MIVKTDGSFAALVLSIMSGLCKYVGASCHCLTAGSRSPAPLSPLSVLSPLFPLATDSCLASDVVSQPDISFNVNSPLLQTDKLYQ